MKIGDVAVPNRQSVIDGRLLHCGSGIYSHAIVGSVEPFVLVSSTGDMVWTCTWHPTQLDFLCQASEEIKDIVRAAMRRRGIPQGTDRDGGNSEATCL